MIIKSKLFFSLILLLLVSSKASAELTFDFKMTTLATGLNKPWGMTALPNGDIIISERNGDLRRWNGTSLSSVIEGVPTVFNSGQGGMLDVIAHPNFTTNHLLYFTYAAGTSSENGTHLAKGKLVDNKLTDVQVLFMPLFLKRSGYHFAGRIAFLPDNTLVFGIGDGYSYKEHAQDLHSHLGKLLRLNDDGSIPQNNPFNETSGAQAEIYSYGHRNPQGLAFDSKRNILFSNEHGPKGGDEINIIKPSLNYGWPAITYGVDYSDAIISEHSAKQGMQQPLVNWTPSIAPSSMVVYYGKAFPQLNGHLLNTALKFQELRLVELVNDENSGVEVKSQTTYLKELGERFRDIELDSEGNIYLLTDSGKLIKLEVG